MHRPEFKTIQSVTWIDHENGGVHTFTSADLMYESALNLTMRVDALVDEYPDMDCDHLWEAVHRQLTIFLRA